MKLFQCNSNKFVIHRHIGVKSKLHYDIRLSYKPKEDSECRLLSFATKKFIDLLYRKVKRIQLFPTRDHDLEYASFEGENEEGKTEIYDSGFFKPIEFTCKKIVVVLMGKKVKDCFYIIRIDNNKTENMYSDKASWIMGRCKNY